MKMSEVKIKTTVNIPEFGNVFIINKTLYGNSWYTTFLKENSFQMKSKYIRDNQEVNESNVCLKEQYTKYILENLHTTLTYSYKLGSDPEIFVEDKFGVVIPAFNFLKDKTSDSLYWDGFQAEFNTRADTCLSFVVDSVQSHLKKLYTLAKKADTCANLSAKPTVDVPIEFLMAAKEEHVTFGCMPSLNIYDMEGIKIHGREVPFRSAGGHIHFGIGKREPEVIKRIVAALDAILGVACVSLFASYDNPNRRKLYGLAGEYRLPPHGLEYRTLSNAWMYHPLIMHIVFDLARKALRFGEEDLLNYWVHSEAETIRIINECDVVAARKILETNKLLLINIIAASYNNNKQEGELIYNIFLNGMESAVAVPEDIAGNWNLNTGWTTHSDGNGKSWRFAKDIIMAQKKVS